MDTLEILKDLCIILVFGKFFSLVARKLHMPEVAGLIISGILIGPSVFGLVKQSDFLSGMGEIGVILLMFSAGLETDMEKLKESGLKATLIACRRGGSCFRRNHSVHELLWVCRTRKRRVYEGTLYRDDPRGNLCFDYGSGAQGAWQAEHGSRHDDHERRDH